MTLKRRAVLNGFDLKRKYRQNMLVGFVSAGLFILMAFGLASGWNKNTHRPIIKVNNNDSTGIVFILPPTPDPLKPTERINTGQPPEPPNIGIIVAVPPEEAPQENTILTQDELKQLAPPAPIIDPESYSSDANIERIISSIFPKHTDFVPYDEGPVYVNQVHPEYPSLAQKAGMEGTVWLKVLIDINGDVRDVRIFKDSGSDAGFEEAAIKAARESVWKPALANGQPIAVWVSFATKFKLQ